MIDLDAILQRWPQSRLANSDERSDVVALVDEVRRLTRELERHRHGNTIEGDAVCPHELELTKEVENRKALQRLFRTFLDLFPYQNCVCGRQKERIPSVVREAIELAIKEMQ